MPKLPMLQLPQYRVPSASGRAPKISADVFMGGARDIEAVAGTIVQIGQDIDKAVEKNRKRRTKIGVIRAKNYIREREVEFAAQIREDPEYWRYQDKLKDFHQSTAKGLFDMFKGQGSMPMELLTQVDDYLADSFLQQRVMVENKSYKMGGDDAVAEFSKSTQLNTSYAAESQNPDDVAGYRREVEEEGESLIGANYMTRHELQKHMVNFDNMVAQKRKDNAVAKWRTQIVINPEAALEELSDPTILPETDEKDRAMLTEHAMVQIRIREGEIDKTNKLIQSRNASLATNEFIKGTLTLQRLDELRTENPGTGQFGLSDSVYASYANTLKEGKDVETDSDTFNELYLDRNLTLGELDAKKDMLSAKDYRMLLKQVKEQRDDAIGEMKAKKKSEEEKRIEKQRITRANIVKKSLSTFTKESGMSGGDTMDMMLEFQGYIDDPDVDPKDFPKLADEMIKAREKGTWKWVKGVVSAGYEAVFGKGEEKGTERPARKSLDEIFGGKPKGK